MSISWILTTEDGKQYQRENPRRRDAATLPAKLPEGYHSLTLTQEGERCALPDYRRAEPAAMSRRPLKEGKKLWGTCVQLYTLRSEKNWGIGDFGDLRAMLPEIARRGGSFIGLNPIHALYPANPESASPYSPSSRRWLNVIYIDVNAVEDFQRSEEAQAWWQSPATQQALQAARGNGRCGLYRRHYAENDRAAYGVETILSYVKMSRWQRSASLFCSEGESLYWQAAFRCAARLAGDNRTRCAGAGRPGRRPFRISTARR